MQFSRTFFNTYKCVHASPAYSCWSSTVVSHILIAWLWNETWNLPERAANMIPMSSIVGQGAQVPILFSNLKCTSNTTIDKSTESDCDIVSDYSNLAFDSKNITIFIFIQQIWFVFVVTTLSYEKRCDR